MKSQNRAAAGLQLTLADAENIKMQFQVIVAVGRSGGCIFLSSSISQASTYKHSHHSYVLSMVTIIIKPLKIHKKMNTTVNPLYHLVSALC